MLGGDGRGGGVVQLMNGDRQRQGQTHTHTHKQALTQRHRQTHRHTPTQNMYSPRPFQVMTPAAVAAGVDFSTGAHIGPQYTVMVLSFRFK